MDMKDALEMTGAVETMALARACMTGDVCRDVHLAKNLLTAMHKIDEVHVNAFMSDLTTVGFFAKYGRLIIGFPSPPSLPVEVRDDLDDLVHRVSSSITAMYEIIKTIEKITDRPSGN